MNTRKGRVWTIAIVFLVAFLFGVGFELGSKDVYAAGACCSCYAQLNCPVTCNMGGKLVGSECQLCDPEPFHACTLCRCQ